MGLNLTWACGLGAHPTPLINANTSKVREVLLGVLSHVSSPDKRNNFNLLLHETFGGGFSPTAVLKLRRLARKVARGSVDRTAYSPKYSLSFMSHHAVLQVQSASLSLLCEA